MSSWPDTLPTPRRSDYALESGDSTARTDMDSGPARVRRRSTSSPDHVTLSYVFTDAEMVTFREFWKTGFMHGSAWVFMPIKDGLTTGLVTRECRPTTGKFKSSLTGAVAWIVSLEVEVRHA